MRASFARTSPVASDITALYVNPLNVFIVAVTVGYFRGSDSVLDVVMSILCTVFPLIHHDYFKFHFTDEGTDS